MAIKTVISRNVGVPQPTLGSRFVWVDNDLIGAQFKGKEAMKGQFIAPYKENLALARGMSETLVERIMELCHVEVENVRLKADAGKHFTALLTIPGDAFLDVDVFTQIGNLADDFNPYSGPDFSICFLFMPKSESLNMEALAADGYFIKLTHEH